jgi:uncharacterized membrane protein YozB (DUF420 family)
MSFPFLLAFSLPRLNLHFQIAFVFLLSAGTLLARAKCFRLHGTVQSAVVLLNLGFILRIMVPSFRHQVLASLSSSWKDSTVAIALLHSLIGALAWLVAFYVVLVAGTSLIPRKFRFSNYRRWMWIVFMLWWVAFGLGCVVYYRWYVDPPDRASEAVAQTQQATFRKWLR